MWKNRRSQKLDKKAILDLQASLSSEIHAKGVISKQLTDAKSKQLEAEKFVGYWGFEGFWGDLRVFGGI